ncbi:MAG: hypothetical protein UZ14_CFX002001165 [Chloroflexi bacterium OLB14]|nr:MAG: hypothetical protein UZ14_CFX002001165 [Chloroflexi bacterium OLB14]
MRRYSLSKADMLDFIEDVLSRKLPYLSFVDFPSKKFMRLSYQKCYEIFTILRYSPEYFELTCSEFGLNFT